MDFRFQILKDSEVKTDINIIRNRNHGFLSLRLGHRKSIDIDLFTDAQYDSLDFKSFENYLKRNFTYYCNTDPTSIVGLGRGYFIGYGKDE